MNRVYKKYILVFFLCIILISVNCVHGLHMHGNSHNSKTTMHKKILKSADFDNIKVAVNSFQHPIYSGQPFELEILVTNRYTFEPVANAEISVKTENLGEELKNNLTDYPSRRLMTDKNGASKITYLFPEAGRYKIELLILNNNKSNKLNLIENVLEYNESKKGTNFLNNNWFYIVGSSAMFLLMLWVMGVHIN